MNEGVLEFLYSKRDVKVYPVTEDELKMLASAWLPSHRRRIVERIMGATGHE